MNCFVVGSLAVSPWNIKGCPRWFCVNFGKVVVLKNNLFPRKLRQHITMNAASIEKN